MNLAFWIFGQKTHPLRKFLLNTRRTTPIHNFKNLTEEIKEKPYAFTSPPHSRGRKKVGGIKNLLDLVISFSLSLILLTLGCQPENSPVPINSEEDMCEYCRMTIVDLHYAAEIIEKRKAHKFDDIGCLLAYAQANKLSPENARIWVMDFDNSTWIKGKEAYFIISPEIHTPMGYGIVAFKDPNKAKEVADQNKVEVVELETIFDIYWKPRHEH
jgi:copper chaperone NosL